MQAPRLSIKSAVVQEGRLLVVEARNAEGPWFCLPGGGQHHGESVHEALQREYTEEIGTAVIIHDLLFVGDYIGRNHEFRERDGDAHQVELMFRCSLPEGRTPRIGSAPDGWQSGVAWIGLRTLAEQIFYPRSLRSVLAEPDGAGRVYLGDVD